MKECEQPTMPASPLRFHHMGKTINGTGSAFPFGIVNDWDQLINIFKKIKIMESKRVLKFRKKFWINLLIGLCGFNLYLYFERFSIGFKVTTSILGIVVYIYAYICGYSDGKEHIKCILDFIDKKLRWQLDEAEQIMYHKEDQDYYNRQN